MTPQAIRDRCVIGEGDCWEWTGAFDHSVPVITVRVDGKRVKRSVRGLFVPASPGRRPSARCGNWRCVNPAHVEMRTRRELMLLLGPQTLAHTLAIRAGKRRAAKKLDLQKAREIRARLAEGEAKTRIAAEYGVHRSMVRLIEVGRVWAEVTPWSI